MTHQYYQKLSAPLRVGVIALWILSLISVGVSPLYYVSTAVLPTADSATTESAVSKNTSPLREVTEDSHSAYSFKLTRNPFLDETNYPESTERDSPGSPPLDSDGGLTRHAPVGIPVVLWLVSAGASGTVGSSNLTRFYTLSDIDLFLPQTLSGDSLTATAIQTEHPAKRFAATLLGQKPSGVS